MQSAECKPISRTIVKTHYRSKMTGSNSSGPEIAVCRSAMCVCVSPRRKGLSAVVMKKKKSFGVLPQTTR